MHGPTRINSIAGNTVVAEPRVFRDNVLDALAVMDAPDAGRLCRTTMPDNYSSVSRRCIHVGCN